MPIPLPEGSRILVARTIREPGYSMPSLEMATDHYTVSFIISGERRTITPLCTYSYHGGNVAMSPPFAYHRTVPESDTPCESIMIKFSPDFIVPFAEAMGQNVLETLYEERVCCFTDAGKERIGRMFAEIEEEYRKDMPYREFILQGMLFRMFAAVWEERLPNRGMDKNPSPLTPPVVDALYYMENFYNQNPSLGDVARTVNFSEAYFSRLFREQLGMPYSEYLIRIKLRHVSDLLIRTDKSVMEIAQETGYCHGNYLCDQFKKRMGMTPGQFRKNAGERRQQTSDRLAGNG